MHLSVTPSAAVSRAHCAKRKRIIGRRRGRPSNDMEEIGRKHPLHQPDYERHNTPVIVFVTVCTKNRKAILTNDSVHQLLRTAWQIQPSWLLGRYVIMPDHIHLFCAPAELIGTTRRSSLQEWVSFWKSYSARRWPRRQDARIWQRHFWDTQLRRREIRR